MRSAGKKINRIFRKGATYLGIAIIKVFNQPGLYSLSRRSFLQREFSGRRDSDIKADHRPLCFFLSSPIGTHGGQSAAAAAANLAAALAKAAAQ